MNKHLFVINPVSGGIEKDRLIRKIEENYTEAKSFSIYQTTGTNDYEKVTEAIESFQPDSIILAGGDGTINEFIPLIIDHGLKMGIIPAGSANGLAKDLGITLQNALTTIRNGKSQSLDAVLLDNNHYMIHLADFGLNAMLVKRYAEEKRRGIIGYAISAVKEMPSIEEPFKVTLITSEGKKTYSTKFLVIANARMYGTGFEINPNGINGDGKIELCILKEFSSQLILDLLDNDTNPKRDNFFERVSVSKAELIFDQQVDFQSDGEYMGKKEKLSLKVIPQAISVFIPG